MTGGTSQAAAEPLTALLGRGEASSPAFIAAEDGHVLTHAQLAAGVETLAQQLARAGVRRGDRVALALPNGPDSVLLLLAVTALGAAAAPLNPAYTQAEFTLLRAVDPAGGPASEFRRDLADCDRQVAAALPADEATWERGRGWALYHGLRCAAYSAGNQLLGDIGRGPSRARAPSAGSKTSFTRRIRACCQRGTPSVTHAPRAVPSSGWPITRSSTMTLLTASWPATQIRICPESWGCHGAHVSL